MRRFSILAMIVLALGALGEPSVSAGSVVIGSGAIPRLRRDTAGDLYLVYMDANQVQYRVFATSWSAPEIVPGSTDVALGKFARHRMYLTPDGSRVYVSWGTGYDTDMLLAYRDGSGWHGPEVACANTVRPWEYAAVAARPSGDVYVFCQVDDLWVAHRDPGGTWDAPLQLWNNPLPTLKHITANTDSTGEIHAFCRYGPVQVLRGDGTSWSPRYSLNTAGSAEQPAFALDSSDHVHLVWQDWREVSAGVWQPDTVRYATGRDDQWSNGNDGVVVHAYVDSANPPEIAVGADGRLRVTWIEGSDVLYAESTDGGASWTAAQALAGDARPVEAGNLEHDLRTPPSVFVGSTWNVVYENDAHQLVHYTEQIPVPTPDAGVAVDAGGEPPVDAAPDAAASPDAAPAPDAASLPDAGDPDPDRASAGCSCHTPGAPGGGADPLLLVLVVVVVVRRLRRA